MLFDLQEHWVRLLASFSQFAFTFPLLLVLEFELNIVFVFKFDSGGNWYGMKLKLEINLEHIMIFKFWINSGELDAF